MLGQTVKSGLPTEAGTRQFSFRSLWINVPVEGLMGTTGSGSAPGVGG